MQRSRENSNSSTATTATAGPSLRDAEFANDAAEQQALDAEIANVEAEMRRLQPRIITADLEFQESTRSGTINFAAFKNLDDELWPIMPWATHQFSDAGLEIIGRGATCRALHREWQKLVSRKNALLSRGLAGSQLSPEQRGRAAQLEAVVQSKVAFVQALERVRYANVAHEAALTATHIVRLPQFAELCLPDEIFGTDAFGQFLSLEVEPVSQQSKETSWGGSDLRDIPTAGSTSLFLARLMLPKNEPVSSLASDSTPASSIAPDNLPFIGRTSRDDAVLGRLLRVNWQSNGDPTTDALIAAADEFSFTEEEALHNATVGLAKNMQERRQSVASRETGATHARKALGLFSRLVPRINRCASAFGSTDSILPAEGALAVCRLAHLLFKALVTGLAGSVKNHFKSKAKGASGAETTAAHAEDAADEAAPTKTVDFDAEAAMHLIQEWERLSLAYSKLAAQVNHPKGFLSHYFSKTLPKMALKARQQVSATEKAVQQATERAAKTMRTFLGAATFADADEMAQRLCMWYGVAPSSLSESKNSGQATEDHKTTHAAAVQAAALRRQGMNEHQKALARVRVGE